jgi:hypothetical protein
MNIRNAHFLKVKWNFLMGILIGFALLFSTSSFASSSTMQMPTDHSSAAHKVVTDQVNAHDAEAMDENHGCCTDNEKSPCKEDGDCKMSCMGFCHSCAVLTVTGNLPSIQNLAVNTPDYTIEAGILSALNAPPPRA